MAKVFKKSGSEQLKAEHQAKEISWLNCKFKLLLVLLLLRPISHVWTLHALNHIHAKCWCHILCTGLCPLTVVPIRVTA